MWRHWTRDTIIKVDLGPAGVTRMVKQVTSETPQRSVRGVLSSVTSVNRALRFDLRLTPYTVPLLQHLKQSDVNQRLDFSIKMTDNAEVLKNVMYKI